MVSNSFPFSVLTDALNLYSGNLAPTVSMGMLRLLSFSIWTMSRSGRRLTAFEKKSGLAPSALPHPVHDHLVIVDLESLQRFDVADLDLVPRDVVNRAAFVDEMM